MVSDIRQNRIPVTEHAQFPLRSGPYLVYMIMDGAIAGAYDLEETLGKGRFAVVRSARHVFTGERVAVKVIDKTKLDEISRDHLYKEVNCLKLVQHPNIVRLYEVIDTLTKLYLILELGDGGDLYDVILKKGRLKEEDAKTYFRQVLLAVEYCHKLHVVHRDLKPDNIIFFSEWPHVRLTDFGLSNIFRPGEKLSTSCGSMNYTAPEILRGDNYDGPAGDVWSLGVILYHLVVGQQPFSEANDSETVVRIIDGKYEIPGFLSAHCSNIIRDMLQVDPEKRPSAVALNNYPWLNGVTEPTVAITPMVDREEVSQEEQSEIIDKMVKGCIASQEDIEKSLTSGCYDHVTATFYLLAESHLRRKRLGYSPTPHSHTLRKLSMPDAFASLALSPRGGWQKPLVLGSAAIDASALKNAISPCDLFDRIRKRSAAETGVLRPRAYTAQNSPVQRERERGGLNLSVSSPLSVSPVFGQPSQRLPSTTSSLVSKSDGRDETNEDGVRKVSVSVCNGLNGEEHGEHRTQKKSVTFSVEPASVCEAPPPTEEAPVRHQWEEKESPRRSGVVGLKGRRLKSAHSSPQLYVRPVNESVYSDDEEVNLLLSPEIKRTRSPSWSTQRSRSPSPCCVHQHMSNSPITSPERRKKWNMSPVFVRISRGESPVGASKEMHVDMLTDAQVCSVRT